MAPTETISSRLVYRETESDFGSWRNRATDDAFILEAWSEGCMVGALMIMSCVTVANMRRGVLLHKLILLELLLAITHGTFCFMAFEGYGWYLSSTAALLYCSYFLHNIVAWVKIRPFFVEPRSLFQPTTAKIVRRVYLTTLALTIPPMILQIVNNFLFFNNKSELYNKIRPAEPLFRDPWWIFTCLALFHVIRKCYGSSVFALIARCPRFGILLAAICLSIVFTLMDTFATLIPQVRGVVNGINPYWKLALIFKCLTDNIMLDDFKTELQRLGGGTNLERDIGPPPSPLPLPRMLEKSSDDHIEVTHALDAQDRDWDWVDINPPKAIHQPFSVSRSLP